MATQERVTPLRPVNVYYPGLNPAERNIMYGYAYQVMHPRRRLYQFFNSDYPYSTLVSSTPNWVGRRLRDVLPYVREPVRVIRPRQIFPTSYYVGDRLNIYVDDNDIITSFAYH